MKRIEVKRVYLPKETLSSFYLFEDETCTKLLMNGKGLEPPDLNNAKGKSCIMEDTYTAWVELTSPKHKYPHIRLEDKHGRESVLWHGGNYYTDSEACYLPGSTFGDRNKDGVLDVLDSRKTLDTLIQLLPPPGEKFTIRYSKKGTP